MFKTFRALVLRLSIAALTAAFANGVHAVTVLLNRTVETNQTNRPFFDPAALPGFANEAGYVGTATPGVSNSSTVTNADAGLGGNSTPLDPNNDVPIGVGIRFGASFTVETVDPAHLLTDAGNSGLGVDSSATQADSNAARLTSGEILRFSDIQLAPLTVHDPLGLFVPGSASISNPRWRSLRSNTNNAANSPTVTVSSDAAGTQDVAMFAPDGTPILNDTAGVFTPISPLYVNTTAGNWPLKAIGYQVELNFELATPPPTRRSFYFGDPAEAYDGQTTHQFTDNDATVTITAVGDASAALDVNDLGVGVNSAEDDVTGGSPTTNNRQRFIDGTLTTPEAVHFSFDRDVSLESLTLGNIDLDGTEGVVLSFVSGTNPFTGLAGYSGDYTVGATSITFSTDDGGQTPYTFTYGKNGQDELLVEAGTVLALTANPAADNGFLLDALTVHVQGAGGPDADFDDDGDVDADDLGAWTTHVGSETATHATGDADADADVDGADFLAWQRQLTPPATVAGVPEPTAAGLLVVGLVAAACRRKG
ncbi:MAG TPA: hypothetical protein VF175_13645 [Lacipirellula sp.]